MIQARSKGAHEEAYDARAGDRTGFFIGAGEQRCGFWQTEAEPLSEQQGTADRSAAPCISPVIYRTGRKIDAITRFTCSGLIGRAKAAHAAWFMRSTSGATASSASALSAASSG